MDYIQKIDKEIERIVRAAEVEVKKAVKAAVVQSFKNGIDVGKTRKAVKGAKPDRDVTAEKNIGQKS